MIPRQVIYNKVRSSLVEYNRFYYEAEKKLLYPTKEIFSLADAITCNIMSITLDEIASYYEEKISPSEP